jgi:secreted PhoX family phosphatase
VRADGVRHARHHPRGERQHRLVQNYLSLNGTIVNCGGGIAFGVRGWLTCEETTAGPPAWGEPHGYVFEVPLDVEPGALRRPEPVRAMGRFAHEAVAVDQRTGIAYLTEDAGSGVGYPDVRPDGVAGAP